MSIYAFTITVLTPAVLDQIRLAALDTFGNVTAGYKGNGFFPAMPGNTLGCPICISVSVPNDNGNTSTITGKLEAALATRNVQYLSLHCRIGGEALARPGTVTRSVLEKQTGSVFRDPPEKS